MYRKYLSNDQKNNLEKIIRAGDDQLLTMHTEIIRNNSSKEEFYQKLVALAEKKTLGFFLIRNIFLNIFFYHLIRIT